MINLYAKKALHKLEGKYIQLVEEMTVMHCFLTDTTAPSHISPGNIKYSTVSVSVGNTDIVHATGLTKPKCKKSMEY